MYKGFIASEFAGRAHWTWWDAGRPWPARIWFSADVYRQRFGSSAAGSNVRRSMERVWHSADGKTWEQLKTKTSWSARPNSRLRLPRQAWIVRACLAEVGEYCTCNCHGSGRRQVAGERTFLPMPRASRAANRTVVTSPSWFSPGSCRRSRPRPKPSRICGSAGRILRLPGIHGTCHQHGTL